MRASPLHHHRRRDSTPSKFCDLGIVHPNVDRLASPPPSMHTRRHSAAGALTGMLSGSPPEHTHRGRLRQNDLDAVRAARAQVCTVRWYSYRRRRS